MRTTYLNHLQITLHLQYGGMLDEMEQIEALWNAIEVGEYQDETYLCKCYQINDFYVDTKKHKGYDVLHGIRTFKNPALLDLFLGLGN